MLLKLHTSLEEGQRINIRKTVGGTDVSHLGALPHGVDLSIRLTVPRTLGASAVVLRIAADGAPSRDLPLDFCTRDAASDTYTITLNTGEICEGRPCGLFYYEYLFIRGWDTLFSSSLNNVDMELSSSEDCKFRLLVYEKDYSTPAWFPGGVMYHIFLDRFRRGAGEVSPHGDAVIDPDWENGIPQYARIAGEPLSNNVFFGGNLWGVIEKLDYLVSLGVTVLYLSPLFRAYSNHRYDTGDYEEIDSLLGGEEAFDRLISEAHARGIRIILDGVFNHTGDDSKYFNRRGTYEEKGAYQSTDSSYYKWFTFRSHPDSYECWWNIEIMPRLNHENEECRRYFTGEGGIAERWLKKGADGWRLDVADELSDEFLDELRKTTKKATGGEGLIIGEVWENAADKIAYGKRRRYFSGRQLDSVMNYPFRNAALALIETGDARIFYDILTELYASYPPFVSNSLMNLLGTHDTERILTRLGDGGEGELLDNGTLSKMHLNPAQRERAIELLRLASVLQFTVFGVPSVYYGDEAGVEGYHDPFCRRPFPWGKEEPSLLAHYRALGELRRTHPALRDGDFRFLAAENGLVAYERSVPGDRLIILANVGKDLDYPLQGKYTDALTGEPVSGALPLPTRTWKILSEKK